MRLHKNLLQCSQEDGLATRHRWFRKLATLDEILAESLVDKSESWASLSHFLLGERERSSLIPGFGMLGSRNAESKLRRERSMPPRQISQHASENPSFTFMDLFAGIGGFHLALSDVGGRCVFACERDEAARLTYAMNFGLIPYSDIRKFTRNESGEAKRISEIRKLIPYADIVAAGFPCQPFSLAGVSSRNFHGLDHGLKCDSQGTLFEDIILVARAKRPLALFLENVRNLVTHDHGRTIEVIRSQIEAAGYTIFPDWRTTGKNWGIVDSNSVVGQRRKRIYLVCVRNDYLRTFPKQSRSFIFPDFPVVSGRYSLRQAIESDPTSNRIKFEKYSISKKLYRSHLARDRRHRARNNGFSTRVISNLDLPSPTLVARYYKDGKDCLIPHSRKREAPPRMLTPQECAYLQTFPKTFWIHPSKTAAYKQFGNAVTVEVVRRIGERLVGFLFSDSK